MKLSEYAKEIGISYRTALRYYHKGLINGAYQLETGTIIVPSQKEKETKVEARVAIYARVSSSQNKANLDTQAERLLGYCMAKGYRIERIVKEIGSGLNDRRKKFTALLADSSIDIIVVEHSDRATRFGMNYIQTILETTGRKIEIVNHAEGDKEDLMSDLISIITSFVARYYGQRRSKRKTEAVIEALKSDD